ncbi:hypothetical protein [Vibrio splendidus]
MILRSPEEILPVDYINHALERSNATSDRKSQFNHPAIADVVAGYYQTKELMSELDPELESHPELSRVIDSIRSFEKAIRYIGARSRKSRHLIDEFDF